MSCFCALWYKTCLHCATRRVRSLMPVLFKPCVIIVFGMQLVRWKYHLGGVHKYLTEYYFLCVHMFYHVLLGAFLLYALILFWQKTAVNFYAAHKKTDLRAVHEALLTCFLLSCITRIITRVQCTKNSMRAVHKSWLACSPFRVPHVFWFKSQQKIEEHTCVHHMQVST